MVDHGKMLGDILGSIHLYMVALAIVEGEGEEVKPLPFCYR
jgi:hypothetical protein